MAKKKNISKKHKFKHLEVPSVMPGEALRVVGEDSAMSARSDTPPVRSQVAGQTLRDFSYVGGDLRRIGAMALVLVGTELVLYYALVHTALGTAVYQLVKI